MTGAGSSWGYGVNRLVRHLAEFRAVYGSALDGDQVVLAVTKDQIKDAPNIDDDAHISESEQDALRRHYNGYLGGGQAGYAETGYADSGIAEGQGPARPGTAIVMLPMSRHETPPARSPMR